MWGAIYSPFNTTINAGEGNDTVVFVDDTDVGEFGGMVINGEAGDDNIKNKGSNSSLFGGEGNDTIYNYAVSVAIDGGADNDSIYNVSSSVTINGGVGNDSINNEGSNVTITGEEGNDSINNYGTNSSLFGGAGNDTIYNYAGGMTIGGGDGKDYIHNVTKRNYTIDSSWGLVTIDAGAGDDTIYSKDPYVSINGGDGNDKVSLISSYQGITVNGGAGNDTVYTESKRAKGILFQYAEGDGKDVIYGFANDDMLKITGDFSTSFNSSKTEIYFKVGSTSNAITLKDFGSTSSFNINGKNYKLGSTKLVKDN
jgi:Ca2+-binding RTX toxin-like protein